MKRKILIIGLVALFAAGMMMSACEIGESPIEIARKKSEPVQETPAPVQPTEPVVEEEPTVLEQEQPSEPAPAAEPETLAEESPAQVTAWAIVDEDTGELREQADEKAGTVQELPFATVLFVLEKQPSWYKVALTDEKTQGWISTDEVYESPFKANQFQVDDLANFYYAVSATMEDQDKKARLLDLLIEQYPQATISFDDPDTGKLIQGVARELALFGLADIYKRKGEYQKAIEAYSRIIDGARRAQVKGYADWNLLKIYRNSLRDTERTIEQALHIIKTYKELGLSGFEWNIWVDLSAAELLLETLQSSNASGADFVRYGDMVISTNSYPPVQIIGSIIRAEGYRKQNDLSAMENAVLEMLKKHPTTPVQYFKKTVDYSTKAISFVVKHYIEGSHDYEAALLFSQSLLNNASNKTLADNARFAIAYISDIWHFNREEVIAAYEASGNAKDFLYSNEVVSSGTRLQAIQGFEPFSGTVKSDGTTVRLEPAETAPVQISLTKGTEVTALYGSPGNFQGNWLKIRTQDNRFGWMPEKLLEKTDLPAQ